MTKKYTKEEIFQLIKNKEHDLLLELINKNQSNLSIDYISNYAVNENKSETLQYIIDNITLEKDTIKNIIHRSARKGNLECLIILLKQKNIIDAKNESLIISSEKGHHLCVKALLEDKDIDPNYNRQEAYSIACQKGQNKVVEIFLPLIDILKHNIEISALEEAVFGGYYDLVDLLLKDGRLKPNALHNQAIKSAERLQYHSIVDLLWKEQSIKNTLKDDDLELFSRLNKKRISNNLINF